MNTEDTGSKGTFDEAASTGPWDPGLYNRFSGHRRRAALELLERVPRADPAVVFDLGCGSGEITRLIARRFPRAAVRGIDGSSEMLALARSADAREREAAVEWIEADIGTWTPSSPPGLIFANASLQWIGGHDDLFPRLFCSLAPGGVFAAQMPLSHEAPSHVLMRKVLASGGDGGASIGPRSLRREIACRRVLDPADYFELLAPRASSLDVWETEYLHVLEGEDPVFEWVSGTGLRPVLNSLGRDDRTRFVNAYRQALRSAYPRRPDGATLYPFRRLFLVAARA